MAHIPENYKVEPFVDQKLVRSRKYKQWTVGDLRDVLADFPDDAGVWVTRYDEAEDDIYIHPLEGVGGSVIDGKPKRSFVTL